MNRTQRIVLSVSVALLIATWLYPPWNVYFPAASFSNSRFFGYGFLFTTDPGGLIGIDWGRLMCADAAVIALGALVIYLRQSPRG
jgi:hypothetical protein